MNRNDKDTEPTRLDDTKATDRRFDKNVERRLPVAPAHPTRACSDSGSDPCGFLGPSVDLASPPRRRPPPVNRRLGRARPALEPAPAYPVPWLGPPIDGRRWSPRWPDGTGTFLVRFGWRDEARPAYVTRDRATGLRGARFVLSRGRIIPLWSPSWDGSSWARP